MAYIRQTKNGTWRAEVVRRGERYTETFLTKLAAQRWGIATEAEILARAAGVVTSTLKDALEKYEGELDPASKGYRWNKVRLQKFHRDLAPWLGLRLPDLTSEHLQDWIDSRLQDRVKGTERRIKGATVRREANLLRSMLTTARRRWKWITSNPFDGVDVPADSKPRNRRVAPREMRLVCRALGWSSRAPRNLMEETALAFMIELRTSMRSSEILALTGETVDLQRRVARLLDSKNGEGRDVPLSRAAVRLLGYVWKPGPLFRVKAATRDTYFRAAAKRAGLVDLHFHDGRAEAATMLSRKVDPMTLAKITGHKDVNILLNTYYRETAEDIAGRL
jgi:integrase